MSRNDRRHSPSIASIQREAVEKLKATIFGVDPWVRRRYITEFHDEFSIWKRTVTREELTRAASRADIVFVGDYHALGSCQRFAAGLLETLASAGDRPLVLALEMVFGRHQRVLDKYLAGEIDELGFLARIRYAQDWGYEWDGYRDLLDRAKTLGVSVLAADAEPRGGLATIRRRDAHAGRRIASLFAGGGRPRVVVLFGESHLASTHLPGEVDRSLGRIGIRARSMVIVQNVEAIYWELAERGLEQTDCVLVSRGRYAVFNASPLAKYEAYRQTLDRWRGEVYDDGRPDLTPTVHHMIDTILRFLGVDPYSQRLAGRASVSDFLVDGYPDVHPGSDGEEVLQVLRDEGLPQRLAVPEAAMVAARGSRYVPGANALFVRTFDLLETAEEASRFIRMALSGQLGRRESFRPADGPEKGAVALMEEALDFLGSKVIDPSRRPRQTPADPALPSTGGRTLPVAAETAGPGPSTGQFLGQRLYEAYQDGRIGRGEVRTLFRRDYTRPGAAIDQVRELESRLNRPAGRGRRAGAHAKKK